jgi:hypothetical protein
MRRPRRCAVRRDGSRGMGVHRDALRHASPMRRAPLHALPPRGARAALRDDAGGGAKVRCRRASRRLSRRLRDSRRPAQRPHLHARRSVRVRQLRDSARRALRNLRGSAADHARVAMPERPMRQRLRVCRRQVSRALAPGRTLRRRTEGNRLRRLPARSILRQRPLRAAGRQGCARAGEGAAGEATSRGATVPLLLRLWGRHVVFRGPVRAGPRHRSELRWGSRQLPSPRSVCARQVRASQLRPLRLIGASDVFTASAPVLGAHSSGSVKLQTFVFPDAVELISTPQLSTWVTLVWPVWNA